MPIDRVIPVKQETDSVGDSADAVEWFNTPAQRNEDALDVRGIYIQNDSSNDATVLISRDASNNLTLTDPVAATTYTLSQLAAGGSGITEAGHRALRDLIHFIDEGPANGFASGAHKTTAYSGPFPIQINWWTSVAQTNRILRLDITYNANKTVATEVWRMYQNDGTTVAVTLTDSYAYSGVLESSKTRTWV